MVGFAFVDDCDLVTSTRGDPNLTPEAEATARMQKSFDHWIGQLKATGGAVVAEKSHSLPSSGMQMAILPMATPMTFQQMCGSLTLMGRRRNSGAWNQPLETECWV